MNVLPLQHLPRQRRWWPQKNPHIFRNSGKSTAMWECIWDSGICVLYSSYV
jgi:hypothetical protein